MSIRKLLRFLFQLESKHVTVDARFLLTLDVRVQTCNPTLRKCHTVNDGVEPHRARHQQWLIGLPL